MAMDNFMARLHNCRVEPNKEFDGLGRSFTHGYYEHKAHAEYNNALHRGYGVQRGANLISFPDKDEFTGVKIINDKCYCRIKNWRFLCLNIKFI